MTRIDENGFLEGSICHWVLDHRRRYATVFTAIRELNRECHRFIDGRGVDTNSELHKTTAVLFARMVELFQGVFTASEHGMTSVSNVVFRALLEAYFHLMAIHRDPTYLKQYLDQDQIFRKHLVNRIRNTNSPDLAALREAQDEDLVGDIEQTIKDNDIKKIQIEQVAVKAGRHNVYAVAFPILSGASHSSAWDIESHLDYDDTKKAIQGFRYGPSDSNTVKNIGLASLVMAEALETISATFNEDRAKLCVRFKEQFHAALDERREIP